MKAVLALIVIYVGTFLVAIQGASNSPVEASEPNPASSAQTIDPVKEKEIRSLLELVGARDTIQDSANAATEQYRQRLLETTAGDRAPAFANAYQSAFQKKFDADAVSNQLVGIYDQHFSEDEIKGLLEFYGSPLGQKVANEMPKIAREVQAATRQASNEAARQAWQDLRADRPKPTDNTRPFAARRRGLNATGQQPPQAQAQVQANSSQP